MFCRLFRNQNAFHNFFRIALDPRNRPSLPSRHLTKRGLSDGHPLLSGFAIRQRNRNRSGLSADQSLPETVQVLRPPGTWAVPGALFVWLAPCSLATSRYTSADVDGMAATPAPPGRHLPSASLRDSMDEAAHRSSSSAELPRATPPGAERLIRWLFGGLIVWGIAQAIGAYTFNHDPRRPLVVLACMGAFLGFWLALLKIWRKRHQPNRSPSQE